MLAAVAAVTAVLALGAFWCVLTAAAIARRRTRIALDAPLRALYETIGAAGDPPRDRSRGFVVYAVLAPGSGLVRRARGADARPRPPRFTDSSTAHEATDPCRSTYGLTTRPAGRGTCRPGWRRSPPRGPPGCRRRSRRSREVVDAGRDRVERRPERDVRVVGELLEVLGDVVLLARDDLAVVALVVEGHGVHATVDGAAEQPRLRFRRLPRLGTAVPPLESRRRGCPGRPELRKGREGSVIPKLSLPHPRVGRLSETQGSLAGAGRSRHPLRKVARPRTRGARVSRSAARRDT